MPNPDVILALDIGAKRIGVAVAHAEARLASPLTTLPNSVDVYDRLAELIAIQQVSVIVVGLPRGLDGQTTGQTNYVEAFVVKLKQHVDQPIHFQDEALTSVWAEAELRARTSSHQKADVDALAAVYILDDFLKTMEVTDGYIQRPVKQP